MGWGDGSASPCQISWRSAKLCWDIRCGGPMCVNLPNLIKIGRTVAEITIYRFFFKTAAVHLLDLLGAYLDQPRWALGWNRFSSFDNVQVSTFCALGLKMPIHAPKMWVWGISSPKRSGNNETPEKHILARKHIIWRIDCRNQSTGGGGARAQA